MRQGGGRRRTSSSSSSSSFVCRNEERETDQIRLASLYSNMFGWNIRTFLVVGRSGNSRANSATCTAMSRGYLGSLLPRVHHELLPIACIAQVGHHHPPRRHRRASHNHTLEKKRKREKCTDCSVYDNLIITLHENREDIYIYTYISTQVCIIIGSQSRASNGERDTCIV